MAADVTGHFIGDSPVCVCVCVCVCLTGALQHKFIAIFPFSVLWNATNCMQQVKDSDTQLLDPI